MDENLAGKTLQSIGQNLKVIARKQHDTWSIMPNLETTAYLNDILMLLGTQEELNQYAY
ncbi:TrkA C-terminal domain-containing protein [Campylobacter lari]|uniref:TrkA C-terminal domain-containing protein n=1 Tax=Campylobacter lari TaxID=201 RepID=UPI001F0978AB|nr:TrkA C-terminal domain-containing protein [Campylobacter lari]MCH3687487.1 TrkA C-terminal domain-containing protein [Campylobacter lari]